MIHFTSIVAPYAQLAMCFVCDNFFSTWYAVHLEKKKKLRGRPGHEAALQLFHEPTAAGSARFTY